MDPISIALGLAARFAPDVAGLLFGEGGREVAEKVVGIARDVTGEKDPAKLEAALAAQPELVLKFQEATLAYKVEVLREETKQLEAVNETIRAEVASDDKYVRRMRPTFGYIMAATWLAQMMAVAYVIAFDTENVGKVLVGISQLSTIWTVGLAVLGIYVYKRSSEKMGVTGGPVEAISKLLGGKHGTGHKTA